MAEIIIKVDIPAEFKEEFRLALANILEQFVKSLQLVALEKRLESKEEQELVEWSVELGRKVNKDAFKNLLLQLPKEKREELFE